MTSQLISQSPGIGGLDEITDAEALFLQNLTALSYAQGDILYHDGSDLVNLPKGSDTEVLTLASGIPSWASSGGTPSGSDTQLQYNNGGSFGGATGILWDDSNLITTIQNATDAASNQTLIIKGADRTTPANDDEQYISFLLEDDSSTFSEFGRITSSISDVTNTSKDGSILFNVQRGNSLTKLIGINSSFGKTLSLYSDTTTLGATGSHLFFSDTGGSADNKNWSMFVNNGSLSFVTISDSLGSLATKAGLDRSGNLSLSGNLVLGSDNITMTGSISDTTNRVTKGWFTDLEVTNAIAGSITGNSATVTGFTPASGSLTLAGADALTLTTTAATNVTLPTTGTLSTLAGTETLTNKTLSSLNTFFEDTTDTTKKLEFSLAGIGTGTTRTVTLQNSSGTMLISGGVDVQITDGGTGASDVATARTNLDVDQAGTDNSTDVTLSGTPDYLTLTGQDIALGLIDLTTDITGFGANVATFLATPSSANLISAVTDETGTGALVFATSPALVTPALGTPSAGNLSNCTAAGLAQVGVVELATTAEVDTGTDSTRALVTDQFVASKRNIRWLTFNVVEAGTDCAVDTNIGGDFVSPIAGTILQSDTTPFYLYATNSTAGVTGNMVCDVSLGGTSIMTTNKLSFDTAEKTTTTSATPPDLTDTTIAVGDILTIDIDSIHTTPSKGLTVYIAVRE